MARLIRSLLQHQTWLTGSVLLLCSCSTATPIEPPNLPSVGSPEIVLETQTDLVEDPDELSRLAERIPGLDFPAFLEESFFALMLRDPEGIIQLGLEEVYGLQGLPLTDLSDTFQQQTYAMHALILEQLQSYDLASLTSPDQLSYQIYEWYLQDFLLGQEWRHYDYPITHFNTGVQNWVVFFFTEVHPLTDRQDAEDYYTRLTQVDEKIDQLIEGLRLREAAGVIAPRRILELSLGQIESIAQDQPSASPFYQVFVAGVDSIPGLSPSEGDRLRTDVEQEIRQHVLPAYGRLLEEVERLVRLAPTEEGVWQYPNGHAYYRHLLHHHTTLDLLPEDVHQLGLDEVDRIQREIGTLFDELGYPSDTSLPAQFLRVLTDGGFVPEAEIVYTYQSILQDAEARLPAAFDLQPRMEVVVIGTGRGGFYVPGAVDGSRPAAFYATVSSRGEPWYGMPTLTYHETIPGHHLQIALALESDLPSFRKGASFTSFDEGWALYAERLASDLGWYKGDPYGDLGRLQMELFRAARLVVDTGIHAFGWTYDDALQYMLDETGMDRDLLEFEVARYIAWPSQATAYKIGMESILDLRQQAMDQLGQDFNLQEFHTLLLNQGSLPLPILEALVIEFIQGE